MNVRDKIAGFLRGGQDRRAWLDEQNAALMTYVPPELRAWSGLAAEANPVVSMERAGTAANKARTSQGWDRVAALGDVASNVAGVVAPVAAAKGAGMPAVQALEEALLGMSAQPRAAAGQFAADESGALRLFHGSPHDFDKFSMDKIGTGEGAQAYGHGLYFAENEGVARGYRDTLSLSPFRAMSSQDPNDVAAGALRMARGDRVAAAKILRDNLADVDLGAGAEPVRAAAALLEGGSDIRPPGRLYEVQINANPDDFLDWDKPLSEQPQKVRDAIERVTPPKVFAKRDGTFQAYLEGPDGFPVTFDGATREEAIQKAMQGLTGAHAVKGNVPSLVSRELSEAGIPGIRYLDAGSRGAGDGSRNYVVFDENLIEIVRKYGIAGAATVLGVSQADIAQAMGVDATTGQPMAATPPRME